MSVISVDVGFSEKRYSFEGPDFGSADDLTVPSLFDTRTRYCATCGASESGSLCVACADLPQILDTMGGAEGDEPDSIGGEDGDVPDSIGGDDDEDEEEDDDTESERASH